VKEPFGHEGKTKEKGNEHGMNREIVLANVRNLATKNKSWLIQQRDFEILKKTIRHILTKKVISCQI
jgi:hypothetical protein